MRAITFVFARLLLVPSGLGFSHKMPKRSYPFGDVTPLQLKVHVGVKQLSQGVLGEQYKREIFEKTKKLLFNGVKAFMGNAEHQSEKMQEGDLNPRELLIGQTLIGHDGKLLKSAQGQKPLPEGVTKACSTCVRSVGEKECCTQCERYVCRNCCKLCSCCDAIACSFCAVTTDELCEQVFCASCSMFEI
ncbi:apoptosis regulatory protein Siva [Discoglossus pictus]